VRFTRLKLRPGYAFVPASAWDSFVERWIRTHSRHAKRWPLHLAWADLEEFAATNPRWPASRFPDVRPGPHTIASYLVRRLIEDLKDIECWIAAEHEDDRRVARELIVEAEEVLEALRAADQKGSAA
jgi:hypothetical protein